MKRNSTLTSDLMKEQVQITKAEKHIQGMLITINEIINKLKVEELEIKANSVLEVIAMKPTHSVPTTSSEAKDKPEIVNEQNLDLDVFASQMLQKFEEEDDSE